VTFRFGGRGAERVQVVFAASPTAMRGRDHVRLAMRREGAAWTVVTDPLAPDIYAYQFLVDGERVNDPANPRFIEEFSRVQTSAFAVPGAVWTTAAATRGAIARHGYASARIDGTEQLVGGQSRWRRDAGPVVLPDPLGPR
jgi:hypothetical protein